MLFSVQSSCGHSGAEFAPELVYTTLSFAVTEGFSGELEVCVHFLVQVISFLGWMDVFLYVLY